MSGFHRGLFRGLISQSILFYLPMPSNAKPTAADQRARTANARLLQHDFTIDELECPLIQKPLKGDLQVEIMRRNSKTRAAHWNQTKCLAFLYKNQTTVDEEQDETEEQDEAAAAAALANLGQEKEKDTPPKSIEKTTPKEKTIAKKSDPPPLTSAMIARIIVAIMRGGPDGEGPDLLRNWNANASREQKSAGGTKGKQLLIAWVIKNFNDLQYKPDSPKPTPKVPTSTTVVRSS